MLTMEFNAAKKLNIPHIVCDRCGFTREYNFRVYKTSLCGDCRKCLTTEQQQEWRITKDDLNFALLRLTVPSIRSGALSHDYRKLAA